MATTKTGADIRTFLTCGAIAAGVNDTPATSCSGVLDRLHVGTNGCPPP